MSDTTLAFETLRAITKGSDSAAGALNFLERHIDSLKTKGWPIKPGGPWELRWYGSGDDRGDHIFSGGNRIAYLGDQHHDAASMLVYHHNVGVGRRKCELCLGAGVAMARVQYVGGRPCADEPRPCPLCTPEYDGSYVEDHCPECEQPESECICE